MRLADRFLAEFDPEMAHTRNTLARVPEAKLEWQPHPRSMSLGRLANFLAILPGWTTTTIEQDSLDLAGAAPPAEAATSTKGLIERFDRTVAQARAAVAAASDEHLQKPWTLRKGDRTLLSIPRIGVLESFVLHHLIHHRAQLGVYLRMNDVPVPAIYGPSADEGEKWG